MRFHWFVQILLQAIKSAFLRKPHAMLQECFYRDFLRVHFPSLIIVVYGLKVHCPQTFGKVLSSFPCTYIAGEKAVFFPGSMRLEKWLYLGINVEVII